MDARRLNGLWLLPVAALTNSTFAADYLSANEAQKILLPRADRFELKSVELTGEQIDKIKELSGVRQRTKNPKIWQAYAKNEVVGWFFIDEVIGKHEFITFAAAISPDGKVLGIEVMSYRETHGGEVRKPEWRKQFNGKTIDNPFKLDVDVSNISGATLSCRNLLDGVKRLLVLHKVLNLNGG